MGLGDWEGERWGKRELFFNINMAWSATIGPRKLWSNGCRVIYKTQTAYVHNLFCLTLYTKPAPPLPQNSPLSPPPGSTTKRNLYRSDPYRTNGRLTSAEYRSAATRGCLPRQSSVHTHLEIVFLQAWLLLQCAYKGLAWYLLPAHPLHQLEQQKHNILRTVHRLRSCCL